MVEVIAWHPHLNYYEELIAIKLASRKGQQIIAKALLSRELRTCPNFFYPRLIIVPKAALEFLPLKRVKHELAEIRAVDFLDEDVLDEIHKRYCANGCRKADYYVFGDTCFKMYVCLSTVKQIKRALGRARKS